MKKSILLTLALGLFTSLSSAAPKKTDPVTPAAPAADVKKTAKDAVKETKDAVKETVKPAAKAEPKVEKKAAPKSKQKPEELSAADQALLAGAKKKVDALTASQKTKLMDLANKGDIKALTEIDGVGEGKAKNIVAERPFEAGEGLIMVDGVGEGTFDKILTYVKGGQAKEEVKKDAKKEEVKKEAPKTEKKEAPQTDKKKAA
jgi:DNA uptake protein ComE-like DNA-binding protein